MPGVTDEAAQARAFRLAITNGFWDTAVKLMSQLKLPENAQTHMQMLVLTEKYLEVLDTSHALQPPCQDALHMRSTTQLPVGYFAVALFLPKAIQQRLSNAYA